MTGATERAPEDEAASHGFASKADLKELKGDLKGALASKEDIANLRTDIANLKNELVSKEELKEFKGNLIRVSTVIVGAVASLGIVFGAGIAAFGLMQ